MPGILVPRGVYTERHLSADGDPLLVAVDSRSREVARRSVRPDQRAADVAAELRRLLDAADPLPLAAAS